MKKRVIIILLVTIEICFLFLLTKSFSNREILKEKIVENKIDKKQFSMFIETDNGYKEYLKSNKFPKGYTLNLEESKCLDTIGNVIEGILSGTSNSVTVTSNKTTYCYIYFDKIKNTVEKLIATVSEEQLWDSTLEGDGYRYVGTNPDNYICFGTTDQDVCKNNTDRYMYRIIGIFEDSEGQQHLKLIKKEIITAGIEDEGGYKWYGGDSDIDWDESDLYKRLNGSNFTSAWNNLITTWNYTATNTRTYENLGPDYHYNTVKTVYLHEMNQSSKTNQTCYYNSSTTADCRVGEWKTVSAKIGLMYVSDYLLSLGSSALGYTSYTNGETLKTGWMHISNNDSDAYQFEWTMSLFGNYKAYYAGSYGDVAGYGVYATDSVRPVFYLESNIELDKGTGSEDDPYVIKLTDEGTTDTDKIIENDSSNASASDGLYQFYDEYRYIGTDPNNYVCFGTTNKDTCIGNTDLYMYRIIGAFYDWTGGAHLKLIKKEALNTTYAWHSDASTDTDWDESDLYKGLNGSYFASNTTYSYMQDTNWTDKIALWDYTSTNTKTYEFYNSTNGTPYGPDYSYSSIIATYLHEMNRSSKTNQTCYYNSSTTADCRVGEWKTVSAKIGLMYVSDYLLSLGPSIYDTIPYNSYQTLMTGWMNISNNDSDASPREWTMSRYGKRSNSYFVWSIVGYPYATYSDYALSVRPVFYLTSDVKVSGEGTSTSPYIIN